MQVSFKTKLEDDKKLESSAKFSAKALFQNRDKTGMSDVADTVLNTTHQNQVQDRNNSPLNNELNHMTDMVVSAIWMILFSDAL